MNILVDSLSSLGKLKLEKLNNIISYTEADEQQLLLISSDTKNLNQSFETYFLNSLENCINMEDIKDGLFKNILSQVEKYKDKYILINLFDIDDYVNIMEEFQFKRDYIPQERLKFIFLFNKKQYETFKLKAYDFFSFNNFFYHFIDNTFTFVNDIDLSELDDMIKEYEEIKDTNISKQNRMKYLYDIGKKASDFSQYKLSLEYLDKALIFANKLKDIFIIANILNVKSKIFNTAKGTTKALEYAKKSLKIYKQLKHTNGILVSLGNMGNIYQCIGNFDLALNNYQKVLKLSKKEQDKDNEAGSLTNIGIIYRNQKKLDLGLEYQNRALIIFKEINNIIGIATCLLNIGNTYKELGKFDLALKYQKEALEGFKNTGNMLDISKTLNDISNTHIKLKNFDLVEKYRYEALEIAKSLEFNAIIKKIENDKINNKEER